MSVMAKPMRQKTKAKIAKSMTRVRRTGKRVTDGKQADFKRAGPAARHEADKGTAGTIERVFGKPGLARTALEGGATIGASALTGMATGLGAPAGAAIGAAWYLLHRS